MRKFLTLIVLLLATSPLAAQTLSDRKLVLMINANEPLRSAVRKTLVTRFGAVPKLQTYVFENTWPVSEPDWSISVIVNEVIGNDGLPTGTYVMSTAYLKQINRVDTVKAETELKNFRCAEEPLRLNAYQKSLVPVNEFMGQAISTGTLAEGFDANVKEIVTTFRERFLDPQLKAAEKPVAEEPWKALEQQPKVPLPRRP